MAAHLTLLDRALILAQHEVDALSEGNVEEAENHFMDRAEILSIAYKHHDEDTNDDYMLKLVAIQGYNQTICEIGTALKEKLRIDIFQMNKTSNARKHYSQAAQKW